MKYLNIVLIIFSILGCYCSADLALTALTRYLIIMHTLIFAINIVSVIYNIRSYYKLIKIDKVTDEFLRKWIL